MFFDVRTSFMNRIRKGIVHQENDSNTTYNIFNQKVLNKIKISTQKSKLTKKHDKLKP